jgi:hypothetical protein
LVEVDAATAGLVLAEPTRPRVSVLGPLTITGAKRTAVVCARGRSS